MPDASRQWSSLVLDAYSTSQPAPRRRSLALTVCSQLPTRYNSLPPLTIPVQYLLYYPRRRRRQLIANAPPSPPLSTWLPACLPWSQYRQILSPQSAPLSLACSFSPTPHFSTSRGCRYHPSNPAPVPPQKRAQIPTSNSLFQIQPIRHPWSPTVPSPLRRDSSGPFCPSSLFTSRPRLGCSTNTRTSLLITREPQASVAMRAPALVAMETRVLFYSIS